MWAADPEHPAPWAVPCSPRLPRRRGTPGTPRASLRTGRGASEALLSQRGRPAQLPSAAAARPTRRGHRPGRPCPPAWGPALGHERTCVGSLPARVSPSCSPLFFLLMSLRGTESPKGAAGGTGVRRWHPRGSGQASGWALGGHPRPPPPSTCGGPGGGGSPLSRASFPAPHPSPAPRGPQPSSGHSGGGKRLTGPQAGGGRGGPRLQAASPRHLSLPRSLAPRRAVSPWKAFWKI